MMRGSRLITFFIGIVKHDRRDNSVFYGSSIAGLASGMHVHLQQ
jgi:hypothetical protein